MSAPGGAAPAGVRATVVVPLHDHAAWIGPLLRSLFAQWRPDVGLLVIDDASADRSFAEALAVLETRPDIASVILRNERPQHHDLVPQVLRFTDSPVIIKADSDDLVLPGRLDAVLAAFEADPRCRMVTSNAALLTEEGVPSGLHEVDAADEVVDNPGRWARQFGHPMWLGATMAFHRSVLTAFPPVDSALCPYGLDIVLAFRAALLGTHHYLAHPFVGWRQHARNTHRVAGVLDPRPEAQERYAALEQMALAQRVRDARHAAAHGADPARAEAVLVACQETFLARFDHWCRLRTRADAAGADPPASRRVPPVPPIPLLPAGRYAFGQAGRLGPVAAAWSGCHAAEDGFNWTSGSAMLVLRVPPGVERVRLGVCGHSWGGDKQRVRLSINFGPAVEAVVRWPETSVLEAPVPDRWGADRLVLVIGAPDAGLVQDAHPAALDVRRLGLMLTWLELA